MFDTPDLLHRHGLYPDKRLGQNFLVDRSFLNQIVAIAQIETNDIVLEIGPGVGNLTHLLAIQAQYVIAIEIDEDLIPPLEEVLASNANVRIVQGDILRWDIQQLLPDITDYLVVANIPYYITSPLVRKLLEAKIPPKRMVLTVQQEVAERICAQPNDMNLLALSVQVYGNPSLVAHIPASAFYPHPKVNSAVIRIEPYPQPLIPLPELPVFFRLAKAGFSQKRKNLRNSLSGGMRWKVQDVDQLLEAANIDPRRRAESLSIPDWRRLVAAIREVNPSV